MYGVSWKAYSKRYQPPQPPTHCLCPFLELSDFGRGFNGEDYPVFYLNSYPLELKNLRTSGHSTVDFHCIGRCMLLYKRHCLMVINHHNLLPIVKDPSWKRALLIENSMEKFILNIIWPVPLWKQGSLQTFNHSHIISMYTFMCA